LAQNPAIEVKANGTALKVVATLHPSVRYSNQTNYELFNTVLLRFSDPFVGSEWRSFFVAAGYGALYQHSNGCNEQSVKILGSLHRKFTDLRSESSAHQTKHIRDHGEKPHVNTTEGGICC